MDATDAVDVINKASTQSDRWMFVAILALLLFAAIYLWKYMASRLTDERRENKAMVERMFQQGERMAEIAANCSRALSETTSALQSNTVAMQNNTRICADISAVLTVAQQNISKCVQLHYINEARAQGKAIPPLSSSL